MEVKIEENTPSQFRQHDSLEPRKKELTLKDLDSQISLLKFNFDKNMPSTGKYIDRVGDYTHVNANHLHLPMITKTLNENSNIV